MLGQDSNESMIGWVLTGVATIVGTLWASLKASQAAQIHRLKTGYDRLDAEYKDLKVKADDCLSDREELRVRMARLEVRAGILEDDANDARNGE